MRNSYAASPIFSTRVHSAAHRMIAIRRLVGQAAVVVSLALMASIVTPPAPALAAATSDSVTACSFSPATVTLNIGQKKSSTGTLAGGSGGLVQYYAVEKLDGDVVMQGQQQDQPTAVYDFDYATFSSLAGKTYVKEFWQLGANETKVGTSPVCTLTLVILAGAVSVGEGPCVQQVSSASGVRVVNDNGSCVIAFRDTGENTWTVPSGVRSIRYLVVAGGGGGGRRHGGGGGAGGLLQASLAVTPGAQIGLSVGAGGAGSTSIDTPGAQGQNSAFGAASALGGGGGASSSVAATSGGSGGGGSGGFAAGAGTSGQGTAGGAGVAANCRSSGYVDYYCGGGGGGAGAAGIAASSGAGLGGIGADITSVISQSAANELAVGHTSGGKVYLAGGGGGGTDMGAGADKAPGAGGLGGGGRGNGAAGLANSGGGGGGGSYGTSIPEAGGTGGSGVIVLRYTPPCDVRFAELNFDYAKATSKSGTGNGKNKGDKMLFSDVLPATQCSGGVDALVTTSNLVSASIANYEDGARAGGDNSYFQADVNITASNGYAEFTFEFYKKGTYGATNERVTLQNVKATGIDIDGYQFNDFSQFDSYTLASTTRLTISPKPTSFPASARFLGPPGADSNSPRDQAVVTYAQVYDFAVKFGRTSSGSPSFFGVAFKELGWDGIAAQTTGTQYTLSYNANGGSGSVPATVTAPAGTQLVIAKSTLTRSGSIFLGWNTSADGSGVEYAPGSAFVMPLNGTTLYARWSSPPYKVTYSSNGATGGAVPAAQTFSSTAQVTVAGNTGGLSRTGYTLNGWSTTPSGSATYSLGQVNAFVMGNANVTLYAAWSPATATITYSANTSGLTPACSSIQGTAPAAASANVGAAITIAGNSGSLVCGGYVFSGWNTSASGSGAAYTPGASVTMPSSGLSLYARWARASYLTYLANGGAGAPAPTPGAANASVTVAGPGEMARAGYTFTGWKTQASGGTAYSVGASFVMPSDGAGASLYAQWSANTQTISYFGNGSTGGTVPASTTGATDSTHTVANDKPSRTDFAFVSWNTAPDGSGQSYTAGDQIIVPATGIVLFAQWAAIPVLLPNTVTYNANGATSGTLPASQQAAEGVVVTVADNTGTLARTGYTLAGWSLSPSGGATLALSTGTFTMPPSDVTLYAVWSPASQTITYNANTAGLNPACSSTSGSAPSSPTSGTTGASVTIPGNTGSLVCGGYVFTGWNTQADGTGTDYPQGSTLVMPAQGVTLYAQWEQLFFLTYNANGGSAGPASAEGGQGDSVTVSAAGTMIRAGYTFAGWNTAVDGSGSALSSRYTMPADNVTVYAQWTADEQSVSYNANGGVDAPDAEASSTGATYTIVDGVPTRTGYTFASWNTSVAGTGLAYLAGDTLTVPAASVILYAQWTPNRVAIFYLSGAGEGTQPSPVSGIVGTNATIASGSTVTRDGYTFVGWNTAADGSGTNYPEDSTIVMPTTDLILYAQWSADPHTIRYDANGGSGSVASSTGRTDQVVTTASGSGLTRANYTFAGWGRMPVDEGPVLAGGSYVMPAGDVVWYAQWERLFTVSYVGNADNVVGVPSAEQISAGRRIYVSAVTPSRTGYWLNGWNTAADGTGVSYPAESSFAMPVGDVTLYAQWIGNDYRVVYNANGGQRPPAEQVLATAVTVTVAGAGSGAKVMARSGFTFVSWNTAPDGSGSTYNATDTFAMPASNVVLYAQWTVTPLTLTYDANEPDGNAANMPAAGSAAPESDANVSPTVPTLSGYRFNGWNRAADGSGVSYVPGDTFVMPAEAVTLYAQWVADTFPVTYDANGGQNGPAPILAATGSTVTVSSSGPIREGFTFAGWNTRADGTGTAYAVSPTAGTFTMPGNSVTLYAQWTINSYTLSYDANGSVSAPPASLTRNTGAATTLAAGISRPGYTFLGWGRSARAVRSTLAPNGMFTMPASDVTLYAQWIGNAYAVEFDLAGGSDGPASFERLAGQDVVVPATRPGRPFFAFTGWVVADTGERVSPGGVVPMPGGVLRLIAQWEYTPPPAPVTPTTPVEPPKPILPPVLQPTVGTTTSDSPATAKPLSDDRFREGSVRLINPKTGTPVTKLTTRFGTFRVNTTSGEVSFTPKRGVTGIAQAPILAVTEDGQEQRSTVTFVVQPAAATKIRSISRTVYFASMSSRLDATDRRILRNLVRLVNSRGKETKGLVVGFVQPVGGVYNDFTLSTARARSVKAFLESLGVKTIRTANGLGRAKEPDGKARRATVTLYYVPSGS